jgi:hypothetical protein
VENSWEVVCLLVVYATSPGTKVTIDRLVETVAKLQKDLRDTQVGIASLFMQANARTDRLQESLTLVEDVPSESASLPTKTLAGHFTSTSEPASLLAARHSSSLAKLPAGTSLDFAASPTFQRPLTRAERDPSPRSNGKRPRETTPIRGGGPSTTKRRFIETSLEDLSAPLSPSSQEEEDNSEDDDAEVEESSLSFGETSFPTDSIMPTKLHSPPSCFAPPSTTIFSSHPTLGRRASPSPPTLPFPSLSKPSSLPHPTPSPFSNLSSNKAPPTPQATKTMYGSEQTPREEGRFRDEMMGSGRPWVSKGVERVGGGLGEGGWGGFGG